MTPSTCLAQRRHGFAGVDPGAQRPASVLQDSGSTKPRTRPISGSRAPLNHPQDLRVGLYGIFCASRPMALARGLTAYLMSYRPECEGEERYRVAQCSFVDLALSLQQALRRSA
jgi:hypothetical protein